MADLNVDVKWYGDAKKNDINNGLIAGLIRSTNLVQSSAKTLVPVDKGILKGSIVKSVDKHSYEGKVSTNIEYAPYVEFGLKSNPNYPKQSYLRPALYDNESKIKKICIDEGEKAVDK